MTIKEVEQVLEIPRATVRFYEKEGLLCPSREENGYRDYSDKDVEKLKKIIILRKIGMSVEDINDMFDGAKPVNEVLDANIVRLQKQMDELKGAINLSKKMKEEVLDISALDTGRYWNAIDEEEKKGNSFIDIAKDIADMEKGVIFSYFSWVDENGKPYDSLIKCIPGLLACITITGCCVCLMEREWTFRNFLGGIRGILSIMVIELILSIPLYFLGKRYPWIKNNRKKVLIITCIILILVLLILAGAFGI